MYIKGTKIRIMNDYYSQKIAKGQKTNWNDTQMYKNTERKLST